MYLLKRLLPLTLAVPLILVSGTASPEASPSGTQTERIYLSGQGPGDAVPWDFYCSSGRKSGAWTTIPVPSNWEQEGFGGYNYGHDDPDTKHAEVGTYRTRFFVPRVWEEKLVRLVFEGSMTETSVRVNGRRVGAVHQGGYQSFQINLNSFRNDALRYGEENELEVRVAKKPSNHSLDIAERKADYWVFGGIYRPVYLEVSPRALVHRVAIDARADGQFSMDVFPQVHRPRTKDLAALHRVDQVIAQVETLEGRPVGTLMSAPLSGNGAARVTLQTRVDRPAPWSPEFPNRYQVRTQLKLKGEVIHENVERFGFRTFELRTGDGLYLNGHKLKIRGINRNGFRPDTARALDPEEARADARAIKAMNANLVRAHLPPTKAFIEACDELGLMFILEQTNWQAPATDPLIARNIAHSLVTDFHNYPSVVLWANGNEGGFAHEVDEIYALFDKQDRPVLHPWALFDRIHTEHYPSYERFETLLGLGEVYLPTESLHGLYDGGHGAGLQDFWDLALRSETSAGLVLWCWADAAIERTDNEGELDTDGDHSADGIVGPYGEKETSYYTAREIWSPVQIALEKLPADFDGRLPVENRFSETDLNQCRFAWKLLRFAGASTDHAETEVVARGTAETGSIPPGKQGALTLALPDGWDTAHALEWTATDPHGREIMHGSWPIRVESPLDRKTKDRPRLTRGEVLTVAHGESAWVFSNDTGQLLRVLHQGNPLGLHGGPVLYAADAKGRALPNERDWQVQARETQGTVMIEARAKQGDSRFSWEMDASGIVTLDYAFPAPTEPLAHLAVGLGLEDDAVETKRWLGDGPFRIWNNRRKGPHFGLWENEANDGLSGLMGRWQVPEFKGVFGEVEWMRLKLSSGTALLLETETPRDLGILRPYHPTWKRATWSYPEAGGLFLFHKVPAVGTKFKPADQLGPQSRPQAVSTVQGTLRLQLR